MQIVLYSEDFDISEKSIANKAHTIIRNLSYKKITKETAQKLRGSVKIQASCLVFKDGHGLKKDSKKPKSSIKTICFIPSPVV